MIVSTKGRYALRVMVNFAQRSADEYIPLKEIARLYRKSESWARVTYFRARQKIIQEVTK